MAVGSDLREETAQFLLQSVPNPQVESVGGEWTVLGLARWRTMDNSDYFEHYYRTVEEYVIQRKGVLHDKKYTEYARVVLALTAIGKDPRDVAGYNLVQPLTQYDKVISQGCNGAAYALLALDCGGYEPDSSVRQRYLNYLILEQQEDGSYSLDGSEDVDVTAMVLTALAPYQEQAAETIDKGLAYLSDQQTSTGGFLSKGVENAESCSQVLVALATLGISLEDERFVKEGISPDENLYEFRLPGGGFGHIKGSGQVSLMATEQAFYALVALERAEQGKCSLYDMKDAVSFVQTEKPFGLPDKNEAVSFRAVTMPGKTFDDLAEHQAKAEIEALASRGIINGKQADAFDPQGTMTRAEFACVVVRALGLEITGQATFEDVREETWYYPYINTAYYYGLVSGVSENQFLPDGTITREEGAAMIARCARLCGMNIQRSQEQILDILSQFEDYKTVSGWAEESLAFCYDQGILSQEELLIRPNEAVKRYEIAQMVYRVMEKANLLQ